MPTYAYRCTNPECAHTFDVVQSFTDDAITVCPECGQAVRKVFSPVGVVFKGSGFYRNDARASTGSSEKASSDGGSSEKSSSDKPEKSDKSAASGSSDKASSSDSTSSSDAGSKPAATSATGSGSGPSKGGSSSSSPAKAS